MTTFPMNSLKISYSENTFHKNITYYPKTLSIKWKTDKISFLHNKILSKNSSKSISGKPSSVHLEWYFWFSMNKFIPDLTFYQEKVRSLMNLVLNLQDQNIKINMIETNWKSNIFLYKFESELYNIWNK